MKLKQKFIAAMVLAACSLGAKAASTTVTVGTKTPVNGKKYYLYDVTHDRWLDEWQNKGFLVTAPNTAIFSFTVTTGTNASSETYYVMQLNTENESSCVKSGFYDKKYVWLNGNTTDVQSQWYLVDGPNGIYLNVGKYDYDGGSTERDLSDPSKMYYLKWDANKSATNDANGTCFTNDKTDEFLFMQSYITPSTFAEKKTLATVINAAAAQYVDNDAAVSVFTNADATSEQIKSATLALLQKLKNVDISFLMNANVSSTNGWGSYNNRVTFSCDGTGLTATPNSGETDIWVYNATRATLPAGYYTYSVNASKLGTDDYIYINDESTQPTAYFSAEGTASMTFYFTGQKNVTFGIHSNSNDVFNVTNYSLTYLRGPVVINDATTDLATSDIENIVTIERTLSSEKYVTLCLPFAIASGEMNTIFGTGYSAYWLSGVTKTDGNYTLNFTPASDVVAGFPILMKLGTNAAWSGNSYIFAGKTITLGNASGNTAKNGITFTGVYERTVLGENDYFISNNKIYRAANSGSYVLPTRAYFKNDNTASVKSMVMNLDGELVETSIEALNSGEIELGGQVYTLSGMRVSGQLRPGIYVRNGKKFVVR